MCKHGGANVLGMHIDEGANVQLCQLVRGQMSLHAIFGQGANVRGGTCPTLRWSGSHKNDFRNAR